MIELTQAHIAAFERKLTELDKVITSEDSSGNEKIDAKLMAEHITAAMIEVRRQISLANSVTLAIEAIEDMGFCSPLENKEPTAGMTLSAKNHTIGMSSFIGDILGAGVDARLIALKLRDLSNITLDREIYGLSTDQWIECLNYCIDWIRNHGK